MGHGIVENDASVPYQRWLGIDAFRLGLYNVGLYNVGLYGPQLT